MKQELTQQELQLIAQIIDAGSRKGLFGAADLLSIGALHNKVLSMLQPNAPTTPETPNEPYIKD